MGHIDYFTKVHLQPGEVVQASADGWIGEMFGKGKATQHNGALVLSNRRIVFVRKGFIGSIFEAIPRDKVSSVESKSAFGYSTTSFYTSGDELTFKTLDQSGLKHLVNLFHSPHAAAANRRDPSPALAVASELEILLRLREDGELTRTEYDAAKRHLLEHGSILEDVEEISHVHPEQPIAFSEPSRGRGWLVPILVAVASGYFVWHNLPTAAVAQPKPVAQKSASPAVNKPTPARVEPVTSSTSTATKIQSVPAAPKPLAKICKAAIATIMAKDPSIISINSETAGVIALSYYRPSDAKLWSYRCRIEGEKVIWASETGRWRTHPADEVIAFKLSDNAVTISEKYTDGSVNEGQFSLRDL